MRPAPTEDARKKNSSERLGSRVSLPLTIVMAAKAATHDKPRLRNCQQH